MSLRVEGPRSLVFGASPDDWLPMNFLNSALAVPCRRSIVVLTQFLHLFPGVRKAQEPMHVQAFSPEAAIESVGLPGREKSDAGICGRKWTFLLVPSSIQPNTIPRLEVSNVMIIRCRRVSLKTVWRGQPSPQRQPRSRVVDQLR
jgi:hypothetical protein